MTLGFIGLLAVFAGMLIACFAAALLELWRPRDPGPLPIDVSRDVQDRHFGRVLRRAAAIPREIMPGAHAASSEQRILALGNGMVDPGATVESFAADGIGIVGEAATVLGHADATGELLVSAGASVRGRATSATRVVLASSADVHHAAAPVVCTTGGQRRVPEQDAPSWDGSLDADFEWLLSGGVAVDRAIRDLEAGSGRPLDGVEGLLRAERRGTIPMQDLHAALRPTWLAAGRGWYIGAATARVPGDVVLPAGTVVPFNLIVEGSLAAGPGVRFHGGIHAAGGIALGSRCVVDRSLTANGSVTLGPGCVVLQTVHAGGDFHAEAGVTVGGADHGGVAAMGAARLGAGVVVRNRIYAEHGTHCDW